MPTTNWSMSEVEFLDVPTFLRKFEQRASGLMWLLGAGASRASGIKTAGDMIWDFKSRLYRSDRKILASAVSDLGDTQIRRLLQNFFDASTTYPPLDSEQEYAHYFEATYPAAQDRRRYIDDMMRGAKPGYAKNQALGFEVPYLDGAVMRRYIPDFLIRLDVGDEKPLNVVLEVKGYRGEDAKLKAATMRDLWIPGVNALGGFGRWEFAEFSDWAVMDEDFAALVDRLIGAKGKS